MRRRVNQKRHSKKKSWRGKREEERGCGAQDCQQDIHAGYETLAGMERAFEERKRLGRKI